jgi:NadR type nicotinamide-nucleotide adenylyltransferase
MGTKGLTLGKFAPFHKGHASIIDLALKECDELVVVVYDAPSLTPIPLQVRTQWISEYCSSMKVKVIEGWASPSDEGYTPEVMRIQEDYIIKELGITGVTHFYSSEPYGENMAKALGAIDRRVDQDRGLFPISGTMLRSDPTKVSLETVPEPVYRSHITTVCLLGAPSTGKSTLAAKLAEFYGTTWLPEYGREYWAANQKDHRLTWEDLGNIQMGHQRLYREAVPKATKYLFADTNEVTTYLFGEYYYQGDDFPHPLKHSVYIRARVAAHAYDKVFVCADDFPHEDTADRSGEVARRKMQRMYVDYLKMLRVPYELLYGTVQERVWQVERSLAKFAKWNTH